MPVDALSTSLWVTDGGLETDLTFNRGIDLPEFAAFPLLAGDEGRAVLQGYYSEYAAIAHASGAGLLLETPTWRANADWGRLLGFDAAALDRLNQGAVHMLRGLAADSVVDRVLVTGIVGPRGDGYLAGDATADEAKTYHQPQVDSFAAAEADLVHAMTLATAAEAMGVTRAAQAAGLPVAISFTVETDGRLPDGTTLADSIAELEATAPADWYGVNCAHPTHVLGGLDGGSWQRLLTFFRPNASTMSHAELDSMAELDAGDLALLTTTTAEIRAQIPSVRVLGGCCGTDSRHVAALMGV